MRRLSLFFAFICFLQIFAAPARAQENPPIGGVVSPPGAMIFYIARGAAGACGNNCSEWIAAEGTVQWDSHKRFLALLDRLGDRKPPVMLNLKGESSLHVSASIGRLIRSRGLDVSAAATRVKDCTGVDEAACAALKRGGQPLDATLDGSAVTCNFDCVLMLAGGVNRTLPSTAQVVLSGTSIRNRLGPKVPGEQVEGLQSHFNEQYRLYLTQMGVSTQIVDIIERNTDTKRAVRLKPEDWLKMRIVTAISL